MNFVKISVEEYSSKTPPVDTGNIFHKVRTVKEVEGSIPLALPIESMDNAIPHFIYGFIAFLAICIVLSVGRAIYYYISISIGTNTETTESSTNTASPSTSSRPSLSRHQEIENTDESNTERLNIQLEKLRKMLNDVNARLGVSRDTIDFPTVSAPFVGNSRQSSSDLDTLWSSIDFDDFESTIYDYNTQKTPTERSVSPSISYSSLDVSRSHLLSNRSLTSAIFHKLSASHPTSREISNLSTPSNAITQLLELLDSFIPKTGSTKFPQTTFSDCKYSEKTQLASEEIEQNPSPYQSSYVCPTLPSSTSALVNQLPSTSRLFQSSYKSEFMKPPLSEPVQQKESISKFNFANPGTIYSENDSFAPADFSGACNPSYQNVFPTVYESMEPNIPCSALKCGNISPMSESDDKITLSLSFETAHGKNSSSEFFDAKMPSSSASEEHAFSSLQSLKEISSIISDSLQPTKVSFMSSSLITKLPISSSEPVVNQIVSSASKSVEMRKSFSETQLFDEKNMMWSSDSNDFLNVLPTFRHTNISSSESTSLLSVTPSETQQIFPIKCSNFPKNSTTESYKTLSFHKTKSDRLLQLTSENLKTFFSLNSQNRLPHLSLENKSIKSGITTLFSEFLSPEIRFSSTPYTYGTPIINTMHSLNESNWRTPLDYDLSPIVTQAINETCNKTPDLLNSNAWSTPPAP